MARSLSASLSILTRISAHTSASTAHRAPCAEPSAADTSARCGFALQQEARDRAVICSSMVISGISAARRRSAYGCRVRMGRRGVVVPTGVPVAVNFGISSQVPPGRLAGPGPGPDAPRSAIYASRERPGCRSADRNARSPFMSGATPVEPVEAPIVPQVEPVRRELPPRDEMQPSVPARRKDSPRIDGWAFVPLVTRRSPRYRARADRARDSACQIDAA